MQPPSTLKQLRGLQGRLQSTRRFIAQLVDKCHPFQHLLRKGVTFKWTKQCQEAFQALKDYLLNTLVLISPTPRKPLLLYISATNSSLGALLAQDDEKGKERAIYYISRTLIGYELNYTPIDTPIEKACFAVIFSSQNLRHYMLSHKVQLIARFDPLKYLLSIATLTRRLAKWVMILSEFDIEYIDRKAIKGQIIADQLAEAPLQDNHPLLIDFLDKSVFTLTASIMCKLYFDGSYTSHRSGPGILFITPQGDAIPKSFRINFQCTNNIAEYEALLIGIHTVVQQRIQELQVYGDSQLIVNQINDDYNTKDDKLIPYKKLVEDYKEHFSKITFEQIPRIQNKGVDAMVTIGSLLNMPANETQFEFNIEQLMLPGYETPLTEYICAIVGPESPWYNEIYTYLHTQYMSPDLSRNQKKTYIRQASRYTIIADNLYKKGFDGTLLRCLDENEAQLSLKEVHDGICGAHQSGPLLSKKLLRTGYYWPTTGKDAFKYVQKCK